MSFHPGQSFTFGETPSATKWNYLWENDYALQDWSAFTNDTFPISLIQDGDITADKLDANAIGHGFIEIGRTTLGSSGDVVSVQNLPAYRRLRIFYSLLNSGNIVGKLRFNNDSGNNYAYQRSANLAAGSDVTSANHLAVTRTASATNMYGVVDVFENIAGRRKMVYGNEESEEGAATTVAANITLGGKWDNTSNAISRVDLVNDGTGDYIAGSEVVVYGAN